MVAMQKEVIDLIGSSTFGLHPKISPAQTWNMFVTDGWYEHYPGWKKTLELMTDNGITEGRGAFKSTRGNCGFVVVGTSLWQIFSPTYANLIGNIVTNTGPVFMAENLNSQICIVDGLNMYIYNRVSNTLTQQSVPDGLTPNYVDYHNTYFLVGNANTTGNGAAWYAFSYDSPNAVKVSYTLALQTKSDYARAVVRLPGKGNNVLVLGQSVGEIHNNVGDSRGYVRVSTINLDYGIASIETIARHENFVMFIGINESSSPLIVLFDGTQLKKVATDGINNILDNLNNPEDSLGFFYSVGNHLFYQFTFYNPSDNKSFICDLSDEKLPFYNISDWNFNCHPARQTLYLNGVTFFVSLNNGAIYQTSLDYTTQDENVVPYNDENYVLLDNHVIPQVRICSTFRRNDSSKFIGRRFLFTIEQGNDLLYSTPFPIGLQQNIVTEVDQEDIVSEDGEQLVTQNSVTPNTYIPGVDLWVSKDGGVTYSAPRRRDLNLYGDRRNRLRWDGLGQANEITFKIAFWGYSRFTSTGGVFFYT